MELKYFDKKNIGGAINYRGTAFQDCVSLIYLFENIDRDDFVEITFETINDFTIRFTSYELCVQAKSNELNLGEIKNIIKNIKIEENKKYEIVANRFDNKFSNYREKLYYLKNAIKSNRDEKEMEDISNDFKKISENIGLDYEKIIDLEFNELPLERRIEIVKFKVYDWNSKNDFNLDVNLFVESLIYEITQNLCPSRGVLTKEHIYTSVLRYEKKNILPQTNRQFSFIDIKKEYILEKLKEDINKHKPLDEELNEIYDYIEKENLKKALKVVESIFTYDKDFNKYKLYLLYNLSESKNYLELKKQCNKILKEDKKNYYANYYMGKINIDEKNYKKSLEYFSKSISEINTFEANYNMALAHERSGHKKLALEFYRKCLEKDNMSIEANINISKFLPFDEAIIHLDKVINLNENIYEAYLYKGKIMREMGILDKAFYNLEKYIKHKEDLEAIKEMGLCLLAMKKIESNLFISIWIQESMKEKLKYLPEGKYIAIVEIMWNYRNIITIKKDKGNIIINTPISEFNLMTSDIKDEVYIGAIVDEFILNCNNFFKENDPGFEAEKGSEYIPVFGKSYSDKKLFNEFIDTLLQQKILLENKNYKIYDENEIENSFIEYIAYGEEVNMLINLYNDYSFVHINIGLSSITSNFRSVGKGFLAFEERLQSGTAFNEALIRLSCREAKKIIQIRMQLDNINIKKYPIYKL